MLIRKKKILLKKYDEGNPINIKAGVDKIFGYRDRVWMQVGQTIQINEFEPVNFSIGHSTDVLENETVEEAFNRLEKELKPIVKRESLKLVTLKNKKGE